MAARSKSEHIISDSQLLAGTQKHLGDEHRQLVFVHARPRVPPQPATPPAAPATTNGTSTPHS